MTSLEMNGSDEEAALPTSPGGAQPGVPPPVSLSVLEAVATRRSVRRFLPDPVSVATIEKILAAASRSPSGTNFQPWSVHVVTGAARDRLSHAVTAAAEAGNVSEEYPYAPSPIGEPYLTRRRRLGHELYRLYGVARDDHPARKRAMLRNFAFFGAPAGLFFTMDRSLLYGSWLDCGMFMQSVMVIARAFGLDTCPQQAWCEYGATVHDVLAIPDAQVIVSGMAIGRADPEAPENTLVSERSVVGEFTKFHHD